MPAIEARERGRERRMRMDDRVHLGSRRVDVAVQPPFRRGRAASGDAAAVRHRDDVPGSERVVGHARRRDQEAVEAIDQRALTLPALPRFMLSAFSARAVAMTCSRSAGDVEASVTSRVPALFVREHRREPLGAARDAALGDESGDEPRGRHVERVVDRARAGRRQRDARRSGRTRRGRVTVEHFVGVARLDRNRRRQTRAASRSSATATRRRTARRCRARRAPCRRCRSCCRRRRCARRGRRRRTRHRRRRGASARPLAASTNSVCGTPRWRSSHAVRFAPCRRGRVSLTQTCSGRPSACARKSGAVAVPQPQVASAPALQCVITLTGPELAARDVAQQLEPVRADRVVDRDVLRANGVGLVPRGVGALRFAAAAPLRGGRGRAPSAG